MHDECESPTSSQQQQQQQQQQSPHQHLYKKKDSNWKSELRKNFMRRLHDDRQKAFDRCRDGLEASRTDVLIDNIIQDEINALRVSEHVSADELNEAIEEFERFRDEIIQQEIDSMMAFERERLEDLASANDTNLVLCPKCQHGNLDFPNEYTLNCERCGLRIHLSQQLPSPFELTVHFTKLFTAHADRDCSGTPSVQQEANDRLFLRCERCAFDARIF